MHQTRQQVNYVPVIHIAPRAHRLTRFQRPAANKHAQAAQQRFLRVIEQRVTPLDGSQQGTMPLHNAVGHFRNRNA